MPGETTFSVRWIATGLLTGFVLAAGLWGGGREAHALEKYGRPLPEFEKRDPDKSKQDFDESLIAGYFLAAAFVSNPTFAARPDNTGLVGMRYMAHLETDLYKKYLTAYTDQNFFSDREKGWIILTEWDQTYGMTGTVNHWSWRTQYERDAPLDKSGLIQAYADGLVNYRLRSHEDWSWWQKTFPKNTLTAYAGLGWLYYNQTYFARPDNTGRALFRYVGHIDLDLYKQKVVFYGDFNMFTDRTASNVVRPSELDWILGIAVRWRDYEVSFYREQDLPLDRGGLIQEYWAVQLRYAFDVQKQAR